MKHGPPIGWILFRVSYLAAMEYVTYDLASISVARWTDGAEMTALGLGACALLAGFTVLWMPLTWFREFRGLREAEKGTR